MGISADHAAHAEATIRGLLEREDLPPPDEVHHDEEADEVVLLWHDRKVAVIVELESTAADEV